MGHRHFYSTSPVFESEPGQNWNHMHTDQHYVHLGNFTLYASLPFVFWFVGLFLMVDIYLPTSTLYQLYNPIAGRVSTSDNGSFIYPVENMSIDSNSISFPSHWNSVTRSNGYASSSLNIEAPPHQSDASGTSHDHFLHSSSAGTFYGVSENYAQHPSSSNHDSRHAFPTVDGGFMDLTMGSGRGPHKRKSPGIPSVCERGSASRYLNAGSSANLPTSSELLQEKPNMDPQYMPWDHVSMTPALRGSGLSIRGESSLRNVRSRSAVDLESNLARTHLSSNHSHNLYSAGLPIDHSSTVDLSSQSSSTLTRDWNQMSTCPAHGRMLLPG